MNRALRPVPLVLAIFAMLLRAALPLGWMPSADSHAPLIICPMMGGMVMPAAPAHRGLPQHHDRFCPFTASLAQLAAATPPPPISISVQKAGARRLPAVVFNLPARPYRSHAPRGPPLLA